VIILQVAQDDKGCKNPKKFVKRYLRRHRKSSNANRKLAIFWDTVLAQQAAASNTADFLPSLAGDLKQFVGLLEKTLTAGYPTPDYNCTHQRGVGIFFKLACEEINRQHQEKYNAPLFSEIFIESLYWRQLLS
jgi:hypothetical protein